MAGIEGVKPVCKPFSGADLKSCCKALSLRVTGDRLRLALAAQARALDSHMATCQLSALDQASQLLLLCTMLSLTQKHLQAPSPC